MTQARTDKFVAMIGFAKRAGKIVYGYDELKVRRNVKLYAISDSASQNLSDGLKRLCDGKSAPLIIVKRLEELVGANCKALGITDKNMAKAMLDFAKTDDRYLIQP